MIQEAANNMVDKAEKYEIQTEHNSSQIFEQSERKDNNFSQVEDIHSLGN